MAESKIKITADTSQAQTAIQNLNKSLGSIDRSANQAQQSLGILSRTTNMAVAAFGALASAVGVGQIIDITARFTDLNSRLINATGSGHAAKEALDAISKSARTTFSSVEETAKVFVRNSMALNELGYTSNEQIKVSEALNNAIAVSGARGVEAASALDAFAQAVARGKMEGEDFNRLIENSPRIVKALADGLGVTTGEFRRLITEGKITSDVMIPALISQMSKLQTEAEAMPATISDAFIVLQNSLFNFIGSTDEALGISQTLSKGLVFLADNIELLVGALGALAIAASTLLIPLLPAVAAMAILAGKVLAIMALGAALGYAAQQAGLFDKNTKNTADNQKEQAAAAADLAAAEERKIAAAKRLIEQQNTSLKELFSKIRLERDSIGLNETELAIKRNLAEAAKILKVEESAIAASVKQRLINDTLALQTKKQQAAIDQVIVGLESEKIGLSILDKNQREIVLAIRQKELEFGRSLTAEEVKKLTVLYQQNTALRQQTDLEKQIEGLMTEQLSLLTLDKDQREIVLAIRQKELEFGRALIQDERDRLSNTIKTNQALRERQGIAEAMRDATREQTDLEKIQRALGLQKTLGGTAQGGVTSDTEFQRDLAALQLYHKEANTSTREAQRQIEELTRQHHDRLRQLELQRIETGMMQQRNSTDFAISEQDRELLQAIGQQERQRKNVDAAIEFEKKSQMEKTQFGIEQGAQLFSALGAQNKKAFEIAKAFNIANAIMQTANAITRALTLPFPFNFIAATAVGVAGMAQVAAIRSQQYSGRQMGGPIAAGQQYLVGEAGPEIIRAPAGGGTVIPNNQIGSSGAVNVNFTITAIDTAGFDELLTERRGVITSIIQEAMLEKGQRF